MILRENIITGSQSLYGYVCPAPFLPVLIQTRCKVEAKRYNELLLESNIQTYIQFHSSTQRHIFFIICNGGGILNIAWQAWE